jgi:hypothetical protein
MTPPTRLAQIAEELLVARGLAAFGPVANAMSEFAIAVALRDREEREQRVCSYCGQSGIHAHGDDSGRIFKWIYRFEYERREGRT